MNIDSNKPLNVRVMARYLGVPATWLRAEAEAGRIPHLRAGSVLLFDREAVEKIILERLRHTAEQGVPRG